jgi:hypothetical protein
MNASCAIDCFAPVVHANFVDLVAATILGAGGIVDGGWLNVQSPSSGRGRSDAQPLHRHVLIIRIEIGFKLSIKVKRKVAHVLDDFTPRHPTRSKIGTACFTT